MKIRIASPTQLILEDTDEWLAMETKLVKTLCPNHIDIDVFPCTSYETSISGLCVSVVITPVSMWWKLVGFCSAIFIVSTLLMWSIHMCQLHGWGKMSDFASKM